MPVVIPSAGDDEVSKTKALYEVYILMEFLKFDIRVYCEMITPMREVNTPVTSHNYNFFFFVVKTFMIYSLSNFQVHNTVFFIIAAMLY